MRVGSRQGSTRYNKHDRNHVLTENMTTLNPHKPHATQNKNTHKPWQEHTVREWTLNLHAHNKRQNIKNECPDQPEWQSPDTIA